MLKGSLILVWLCSLISNQVSGTHPAEFVGFAEFKLGLPPLFTQIGAALAIAGVGLAVFGVFIPKYLKEGRLPPASVWVSWSTFFWFLAPGPEEFRFYAVPFFHCLQYACFGYRLEAGEAHRKPTRFWTLLAASLILAGGTGFVWLPNALDRLSHAHIQYSGLFFVCSFMLIINIHHYFLDSILWKMSEPRVRNAILGTAKSSQSEAA
jgi:hypothetical protein